MWYPWASGSPDNVHSRTSPILKLHKKREAYCKEFHKPGFAVQPFLSEHLSIAPSLFAIGAMPALRSCFGTGCCFGKGGKPAAPKRGQTFCMWCSKKLEVYYKNLGARSVLVQMFRRFTEAQKAAASERFPEQIKEEFLAICRAEQKTHKKGMSRKKKTSKYEHDGSKEQNRGEKAEKSIKSAQEDRTNEHGVQGKQVTKKKKRKPPSSSTSGSSSSTEPKRTKKGNACDEDKKD